MTWLESAREIFPLDEFPELDDEMLNHILWGYTAFPMSKDPEYIKGQLVEHRERMLRLRTEGMKLTREALLAMGWKPPEHSETQKEQSLCRRIPDIETYWLTPTGGLASYPKLATDLNKIEKAEEWLERELGVVHCRRGCHQRESAIERIAIWNVNILKNASVLSISAVAPTECLARLKNWLKVWRWSVGMEASDEPD